MNLEVLGMCVHSQLSNARVRSMTGIYCFCRCVAVQGCGVRPRPRLDSVAPPPSQDWGAPALLPRTGYTAVGVPLVVSRWGLSCFFFHLLDTPKFIVYLLIWEGLLVCVCLCLGVCVCVCVGECWRTTLATPS